MGVSLITVHGRRPDQRSTSPVSYEPVKMIKEIATVPIIANGNCFSLSDAKKWQELTGVDGIMSARGILQNPALFSGFPITPKKVVTDWLDISLSFGLSYIKIHQHLMFMLYSVHTPSEKQEFNNLKSIPAILDFLSQREYQFND
jgi:tRNA-dihydrouridine synthase 4